MRRAICTAALAGLLFGALVAPAGGRVLAKTWGGPNPVLAYALASLVHPRNLGFRVTSASSAPIAVAVSVSCSRRGSDRKHRYGRRLTAVPPIGRRVRLPIRHPFACLFTVRANRRGGGIGSPMAVRLTGRAARVISGTH